MDPCIPPFCEGNAPRLANLSLVTQEFLAGIRMVPSTSQRAKLARGLGKKSGELHQNHSSGTGDFYRHASVTALPTAGTPPLQRAWAWARHFSAPQGKSMDQVEPDSGWAYLMQISNLTPEEYRQVIQDFDDYVKFLNQFSQAWQKGPVTFSEFAKEMGIGLGRGGVHIVEGMVEHPVVVGTTVGLILAAGRWIPHPYVKYVSWGLLAVGVGASSVQMGLGIYEGIQAYRYNSRDRLREASTHFGVGVLGLGLTYFGVKLGNHFAGAGSAANAGTRGGILASALHSPDEIVAALAIIQGARASAQPSEAKDSEKK